MPIPVQKVLLTSIRYLMRPINNTIIKTLKAKPKDSLGFMFFEGFGQRANIFEVRMNRALIRSKGLGSIKPLSQDIAFNKGVEWFTEVFVFYGMLISIAAYEIKKAHVSSSKTKQLIAGLVEESKEQEKTLTFL